MNQNVISTAMQTIDDNALLHPEWENSKSYDEKESFKYGMTNVGSLTYNENNDWKYQISDTNIVIAVTALSLTAFPYMLMKTDVVNEFDSSTSRKWNVFIKYFWNCENLNFLVRYIAIKIMGCWKSKYRPRSHF